VRIRQSQFDQLERTEYLRFEDRLAAWLGDHFPEDSTLLGANGVREKIRFSLQVAAGYGFYGQGEASQFAFLSFLLGPNFDQDPSFDWLAAILSRREIPPGERMDEAFEQLAKHFERMDALEAS